METVTQDEKQLRSALPEGVIVYAVEGPLFFGAVDNFERALEQTHTDPKCVVIRLTRVPFMDITGIQALELAVQNLTRRGVKVMICEANETVLAKLQRAELIATEHSEQYFDDLQSALDQFRRESGSSR